jgi:2'-5' RNA ligase
MHNSPNKRLFIGIKICFSEKTKEVLNEIILNESHLPLQWVNEENFHLTLLYIGEKNSDFITELTKRLKQCADQMYSFKMAIDKLNYFEKNKTPRILWLGTEQNEYLSELANKIQSSLKELSIESDYEVFKPHITIARIKSKISPIFSSTLIDKYKNAIFEEINVSNFYLYESKSTPDGVKYIPISEFKLKS